MRSRAAGTPPAILANLNDAINDRLHEPAIRAVFNYFISLSRTRPRGKKKLSVIAN